MEIGMNKIDPYEKDTEEYHLARMVEEAGEVSQMLGKILRFGPHSYNPYDSEKVENIDLLEMELNQLYEAYYKYLSLVKERITSQLNSEAQMRYLAEKEKK
jgi:Na+/phosphate symporter